MLSKVSPPFQSKEVGALILAPTRELAVQIHEVLQVFSKFHTNLQCSLFVGGTSVQENITTFQEHGGCVVIGTPGRVLDMANRMNKDEQRLSFKRLEVLVLDEADKLLDMGFKDTINQILNLLPKQRRTGLFSATQTKEVSELARAGLRNPVNVTVKVQMKDAMTSSSSSAAPAKTLPSTQSSSIPSSLENHYLICEYDDRPYRLLQFITNHLDDKIIIFCATCACVDYYAAAFQQIMKVGTFSSSSKSSNNNKGKGGGQSKDPLEAYLTPDIIQKLTFHHNNSSSSSPSSSDHTVVQVVPFHGKMIPKKRTGYFQKFKSLSAGVMFSTDVAARGIDIPDVDWIIQMAAPKDPSFFVHRIGRTARAGKKGGALLYITPEEEAYIELLRGRGVPLRNLQEDTLSPLYQTLLQENYQYNKDDILTLMKSISKSDREILESGSTAFISFIRAYKENLCSYIFRLEQLDLGSLGRSYGLLRLPKIAETRGVKGRPIVFDTDPIDTSSIPYRHPEKEKARLQRLVTAKEEKAQAKEEKMAAPKKEWVPAEEYVRTEKKRERKRKQNVYAKLQEEWDELAAEESMYRKFKKGKMSKEDYDDCLTSDKIVEKRDAKMKGTDDDSDDDDDSMSS